MAVRGSKPGVATIHVYDEPRGLKQDFHCDLLTLLASMRYFRSHLDTVTPGQDVEIAVHCDVDVFGWLLQWACDVGSGSAAQAPPVQQVIPLLVAGSFLQMEVLVQQCVLVIAQQLPVVACQPDAGLTALPLNLFCRIAKAVPESVLEAWAGDDAKGSDVTCRAALLHKLYKYRVEGLLKELHTTVCRCAQCGLLFSHALRSQLPCSGGGASAHSARGRATGTFHAADVQWSFQDHLSALRLQGVSWREIYWEVWGTVHPLYCHRCVTHFPAREYEECMVHPAAAMFPMDQGPNSKGRFPCCGAVAVQTAAAGGLQRSMGCTRTTHEVLPPHSSGAHSGNLPSALLTTYQQLLQFKHLIVRPLTSHHPHTDSVQTAQPPTLPAADIITKIVQRQKLALEQQQQQHHQRQHAQPSQPQQQTQQEASTAAGVYPPHWTAPSSQPGAEMSSSGAEQGVCDRTPQPPADGKAAHILHAPPALTGRSTITAVPAVAAVASTSVPGPPAASSQLDALLRRLRLDPSSDPPGVMLQPGTADSMHTTSLAAVHTANTSAGGPATSAFSAAAAAAAASVGSSTVAVAKPATKAPAVAVAATAPMSTSTMRRSATSILPMAHLRGIEMSLENSAAADADFHTLSGDTSNPAKLCQNTALTVAADGSDTAAPAGRHSGSRSNAGVGCGQHSDGAGFTAADGAAVSAAAAAAAATAESMYGPSGAWHATKQHSASGGRKLRVELLQEDDRHRMATLIQHLMACRPARHADQTSGAHSQVTHQHAHPSCQGGSGSFKGGSCYSQASSAPSTSIAAAAGSSSGSNSRPWGGGSGSRLPPSNSSAYVAKQQQVRNAYISTSQQQRPMSSALQRSQSTSSASSSIGRPASALGAGVSSYLARPHSATCARRSSTPSVGPHGHATALGSAAYTVADIPPTYIPNGSLSARSHQPGDCSNNLKSGTAQQPLRPTHHDRLQRNAVEPHAGHVAAALDRKNTAGFEYLVPAPTTTFAGWPSTHHQPEQRLAPSTGSPRCRSQSAIRRPPTASGRGLSSSFGMGRSEQQQEVHGAGQDVGNRAGSAGRPLMGRSMSASRRVSSGQMPPLGRSAINALRATYGIPPS